ncbi:tetratricopeptide repeat protein, partial [Microcoleus sp. herbarium19]|uniref:tetratricopeptide repeat protein n=1 Tax=unclassified Microcoleus TaxID=2642155 RepID=UPI002FD22034
MKSLSLKLLRSSDRKVRSGFLFPLAFCLLSVAFYIPPHLSLPVVAQTTDASQAEGDRLLRYGEHQYQTGQLRAALNSWEQALQIYRAIKNRQREALALNNLGKAYNSLGNSAKAIEYLQQSLALAREIKDREGEALALGNLEAYSLPVAAQAIEVSEAEGHRLIQQGDQQHQTGQFSAALNSWQQALQIFRALKNREGEGWALGFLGAAYHNLGNYAKAIEYSQQWLAIAREIKNRQLEGTALGILGNTYNYLHNYAKAIEYSQQSLAIAREIKNRRIEGVAVGNLGSAYDSLGNYAKAIEYTQQRLVIAREIKDRKEEGAALGNLGNAYINLGNYAKAIEYLQQDLAIAREIKDRKGEGGALGNLGVTYGYLGNYAKAIEYSQQSLAIAREIKDRLGESAALVNLGSAYIKLGNYAKAIEHTQQSLAIAREIKNRESEGEALGNLGVTYGYLGNYAKDIEYTQQYLAIAREMQNRLGEGQALNNLGLAYLKAGNPTEAEKMLIDGIQVWESMRQMLGSNDANKISIFEQQTRTYRTLQQVRVAQNNPNAALEIAERGRARAFVDLLTQRLSSGDGSSVIATAPNQEQIRQIAKAQNATLVQYSIVYDGFQIQGKQETQESAIYIWVIQPTGEITFREVDLKRLWQKHKISLDDLIIDNQKFLAVRSRSSRGSTQPEPNFNLQRLHQLLIDPVASLLPKDPNAHVIFIPQGSLFQVPFPALQDASNTYLIEKHTILTAPSIQVLDLTRQQRQKLANRPANDRGRALVLGNPTMPSV